MSNGVLTESRIKALKPAAQRYMTSDAAARGLYIETMPSGSKLWRYRYKLAGKPSLFAMGEWATARAGETADDAEARRAGRRFTLAEARQERVRLADIVAGGQHPLVAKTAEKLVAAQSRANTFDALAAEYIERDGGRWAVSYRAKLKRFFESDDVKDIGALPVRDISSAQILTILRSIEDRDAKAVAKASLGWIGQVFRYAIRTCKADNDPTVALRGAVRHTSEHHKPLSRADVPAFFMAINDSGATRQTEIALRLLAYLFVRPSELRLAKWPEFDLDGARWDIPAERMKMKRPHTVMLPQQAVALLRELHTLTGRRDWLFPNVVEPRKPMNKNTLNVVIERMGFGNRFTSHGFRATASTMLHEAGWDSRLIELQLAHSDENKSRASYDHSMRLADRAAMMQAWADMLDALAEPKSNVVPLHSGAAAAVA